MTEKEILEKFNDNTSFMGAIGIVIPFVIWENDNLKNDEKILFTKILHLSRNQYGFFVGQQTSIFQQR